MKSGGLARAIELVGWLATACAGLLVMTHAVGWNGSRLLATIHALTPYLLTVTVPVAAAASWRQRHALAITTSCVGLGALILSFPLVFAPDRPPPAPGASEVSMAVVNLLYSNPVIDDAADDISARDADVILFTEYTSEHRAALLAHPLAAAYPHKIDRNRKFAGGIAMWSRYPIMQGNRPGTVNYTLDVILDGPNGELRLIGVHPPTPIFNFDGWVSDLGLFGDLGTSTTDSAAPVVIIGDFNASYWHPAFRDLLGRGFTDAHIAHGRGFSTSWPTDERFPAFVRLDHALTGTGLVSTDVDEFTVTGSDHRGFVVSVVPTR